MKKTEWKLKNKGAIFTSSYERDKKSERIFILKNAKRRITFESWQMAKKLGWGKWVAGQSKK